MHKGTQNIEARETVVDELLQATLNCGADGTPDPECYDKDGTPQIESFGLLSDEVGRLIAEQYGLDWSIPIEEQPESILETEMDTIFSSDM